MTSAPRVAILHDWLNQYGGAEEVLEDLHALFPDAPVFTSMYDPARVPVAYQDWDIRPTFMQRLPLVTSRHQAYLPIYPLAFAGLDLRGYDLVISNSSGFCHGAPAAGDAVHLNYCLTPPRYVWNLDQYVLREQAAGRIQRLVRPLVAVLRRWDRVAVRRSVTELAGISRTVVSRIRRCYGRPARLIYPPVDVTAFEVGRGPGDYFLVVSRLIPYKRVDLAVKACTALGLPLVVAGDGRDRRALEAIAGPTVRFAGYVGSDERRRLLAGCRAFLFPGEEDFGIAPVQAQAAGRPVIAYRAGGALDTVVPGLTGEFFEEPTLESLLAALERFDARHYDPDRIVKNARRFDRPRFRERILDWTAEAWDRTSRRALAGKPRPPRGAHAPEVAALATAK